MSGPTRKNKRSHRPPKDTTDKQRQRELLSSLEQEVLDLHEISLMIMADRGILPPLYGGVHLAEKREAIPLWGWSEGGDGLPDLGTMLLRVMPGVEHNAELDAMRTELGLANDWPVSELLEALNAAGGTAIDGAEVIKDLSMLMMLVGTQIHPAPGYNRTKMLEHIAAMRPYAVFLNVPTSVEADELVYHWEDLENFRAEVLYAESSELLEAAVWEYRLGLALADECKNIEAEGGNPAQELYATDVPGLAAVYDKLIMQSLRLYGTTSALRARQLEFDVIREESGDLVVQTPLKSQVEPISILAERRAEISAEANDVILRISGESALMRKIWPHARASALFCIRVRYGTFKASKDGRLDLNGYATEPVLEWVMADELPTLYRNIHLFILFEFLSVCGLVEGRIRQTEIVDESAQP